ncbi:hypothetical protein VP01_2161g2 [Puccinia sorghi]|uniref:Uncharacterized protein n=1 Tax=Puccinia sorghi TaxID=27349 RepID=A0A0L6V9G6_9BASI|nr:hypothetical protein VP01_2161g2 [Puccinia sorghi]
MILASPNDENIVPQVHSITKVPQYLKKNKINSKNPPEYNTWLQCANNAKKYKISLELKMENPADAIKMAKMEDLLTVQAAHKQAIKNSSGKQKVTGCNEEEEDYDNEIDMVDWERINIHMKKMTLWSLYRW